MGYRVGTAMPMDDVNLPRCSTMKLKNALDDVDIAFRQLEFAVKLLSFCELGNIKPSDFDTDHIVLLGRERLNFPRGKFNDADSIIRAAGTSVLIAFSASVLVLDDAFQAAGMKADPETVEMTGNSERLFIWRGVRMHTASLTLGGRHAENIAAP
jgi:hypothetical protein